MTNKSKHCVFCRKVLPSKGQAILKPGRITYSVPRAMILFCSKECSSKHEQLRIKLRADYKNNAQEYRDRAKLYDKKKRRFYYQKNKKKILAYQKVYRKAVLDAYHESLTRRK